MMAVHESGHVLGAWLTGGQVERVILHPGAISRTDVAPNPRPAIVVWLGPIFGSVAPLGLWWLLPRRYIRPRSIAQFFAGFCLIANGAYIALGTLAQVGDSRVMLKHGSPNWLLVMFGSVTIPLGLLVWHRLGSIKTFIGNPAMIGTRESWTLFVVVVVLALATTLFVG